MAEDGARPIIVRKVVKGGDGHHGGAWKVAYADFVTAMMAFFLLMWLLNATTEKQRKGIADYFDPSIPIARVSGGGDGVLAGESVTIRVERAGRDAQETPVPARGSGDAPPEAEPAPPTEVSVIGDPATGGTGDGGVGFEAAMRAEEARLEALAREIEGAVAGTADGLGEHFHVHLEPEGLVIEIVDTGERALFGSGSAEPSPRLARLLGVLVPVLGMTANPVAVVGHTDATPFGSGRYGNWELSSDRAHAARRLMTELGLSEARIARVSGLGTTRPLVDDPRAPANRRIAITLLRDAGR